MKTLAALAGCLMLLVGCGGQAGDQPPDLRLGRDECAACGMMINEDRCSSALVVLQHGTAEDAFFDDIGCMMRYMAAPPEGIEVLQTYVHCYTTREWIKAGGASYVMAPRDRLKTPMASGIVAVASREEAEKLARDVGGVETDWSSMQEAWRAANARKIGSPR